MKSPYSRVGREHCWSNDKPLRDCVVISVCLASKCSVDLMVSHSPVLTSVHCNKHVFTTDYLRPSKCSEGVLHDYETILNMFSWRFKKCGLQRWM